MLLDFFVEAPGRGLAAGDRRPAAPVDVDFGDAVQIFHIGAASGGPYGPSRAPGRRPSGSAPRRWPRSPRPAAALAREGVLSTRSRRTCSSPARRSRRDPGGARATSCPTAGRAGGEPFRDPALADALERLGAEGAAPFYTGDVAAAVARGSPTAAGC